MSLELYKASTADAPLLTEILQEAHLFKIAQGDTAWGIRTFDIEETTSIIASGDTYIALLDRSPAGTVTLTNEDTRMWGPALGDDKTARYIHKLATRNQFRGQNLGGRIIDWAAGQTIGDGRSRLRLDCSIDDRRLCGLYESLGFTLVNNLVLPTGYNAALYEKPLLEIG